MPSAATLREKIESSLAARIPAALSPRPRQAPELVPTGIAEVDALLEGGLPLGSLVEIIGPHCSGRSTLVASVLMGATRQGASCAYVDAADAFDPVSAAAIGINLAHLLWVRVGRTEKAAVHEGVELPAEIPSGIKTSSSSQDTSQEASKDTSQETYCGGTGRHPRTEIHGMDTAVEKLFRNEASLLRDKHIGNPGTTNRKLAEPVDYTPRCSESIRGRRVEQISGDRQSVNRQPASRGEFVLRKGIAVPIQFAHTGQHFASTPTSKNHSAKEVWTNLDRALRATDLLLNAGGFQVVVLDLGDIHPQRVRRIPLATWYRYRLQAEKSQTLFLILTQTLCANGCASVVLRCEEAKEQWQSATENRDAWPLLTGFQYCISAERKRGLREEAYSFAKKPVSSVEASWTRTTLWAR
jgi:recombination protein RecA